MDISKWIAGGALALAFGAGALAWQDSATGAAGQNVAQNAPENSPTVARIATIDLFRCLQAYMLRPEMVEARDEQNAQFAAQEQELRTRIQAAQQQLQVMPQSDPEYLPTQQALQADSQQYNQFRQQATAQAQQLAIDQSTEAFMRVHEAGGQLARELGYTHLMSSKLDVSDLMNEEGATVTNTTQMIQELLARPVLMAPEGADITERLLENLDIAQYEGELEEQAEGAIDPALPPAPGGGG